MTAPLEQLKARRAATAVGVAVVVLLVAMASSPHRIPLGVVLQGVLFGGLNGLLALGLVLLYRVTRAINFAYGAMGGLAAGIGVSLYLGEGWPWWAAIAISLLIGGVIGTAVGALINWRFSRSPRMVLTVATIGLAQLLGGIALLVPKHLNAPAIIPSLTTGLSKWHFQLKPVVFSGNDGLIVIVVPLVVVAVSWFLLGTDAGRAVRAIADNSDRARLVGIPARRLMLGVWAVSGVVAAASTILAAPSHGIPLTAAVGPTLLLAPLAAAVAARMESLPIAFATSIGLGVVDEVVRLNINKQAVETVVFLVIIVVALLLQRRSESRVEAADESSWSAAGAGRPLPASIRSLPAMRTAQVVALAAVVALAVALPHAIAVGPLDHVTTGVIFGLTALSLVVLSGWGGVVSLGQVAIVGAGAITAGDLMMHLNLDFFLSMVAAAGVGAVVAAILGLPALRVRGIYLTVTTLAFAVAAEDYLYNPTNFPSLMPSSVQPPVLWKRFGLDDPTHLYYLAVGLLALTVVLAIGVRGARTGRSIIASRDNLRAAQAAAVATTTSRMTAFMLSGAVAGIAGALNAVLLGSIGYESFPAADSLTVFAMVVIGGLSSIGGSLAGVALIVWLGIAFPQAQLILTGVGVLVVLTFFPSGLIGVFTWLRDAVVLRWARRRGIDTSVWGDDTDLRPIEADAEVPLVVYSEPAATGTTDRDALLSCVGVNAAYGQMQVLFGVDLTVREGDLVALLGTNGAGKSSLLRAITGLLPAASGSVHFADHDITNASTESIVARGLTMMPGGRGVFPSLSVEDNLRLASWSLRKDRGAAKRAREEALEVFPTLRERLGQPAGDMSGGQQQMLSLAMALLIKPKLLCIDELSLGLAPTVVARLLDAVRNLHAQGTTIVIVEQSVSVALQLAENATFLEKGQVRFTGPTADLLARPDLLRAVFLGDHASTANGAPKPARRRTKAAAAGNGRQPADDAATVLECSNVAKSFGGIRAVHDVTLTVHEGEIVGLIGHNGAGKTTLFDLISGFLVPDYGNIWVYDELVNDFPPHERAIAGLGRSFQDARLFPSMTVAETVAVALERRIPRRGPMAAALRMPASTDVEAAIVDRVREVIDLLGLSAYRNRPIGELSTGTRRIVELACVVAQRPAIVMLDEPSGGIAQAETQALAPLLRQVAEETRCAMVLIDHDMGLVQAMSHRLVALELGAVIADGRPEQVLADPRVVASYLGTDDATASAATVNPRRQPVSVPGSSSSSSRAR